MKLLSVTSFFLYVLAVLLITSCEVKKSKEIVYSPLIIQNENMAAVCLAEKNYEASLMYRYIALGEALKIKDSVSIQYAYSSLYHIHNLQKRYDSAFMYLDKWYTFSEKMKDSIAMGNALRKKAYTYNQISELDSAQINYSKAKDIFLEVNDTLIAGSILLDIAYLQKKVGNFSTSMDAAQEGLEYSRRSRNGKLLSGLNHIISVVLKENGEYEKALEKNKKTIAIALDTTYEKKATKDDIKIYRNTYANILTLQKQFTKAINIYENLLVQEKNSIEIARIQGNLANALLLKEGFNLRSDSLLKKALATVEQKNNLSLQLSMNLKLADLYSKKDQRISLMYINKAIEKAKELRNVSSIYEVMEVKFQTQDVVSVDFKDEFFEVKQDLETKQRGLNILYNNNKFDFDLLNKEKIQAEREEFKISKVASKRQILILALLLILVVLLVAIYFFYQKIKRRHKIEKVKTVHTTEARISTKVHDELANDVYKLMTQLETSEPNREMVLDKLDSIYNNARDISKQIQNVDTGKGFADELNNLFRSYQSDDVNVLLKRYETEIWKDISSHVKTTIYRVLQELLTNMKKHSDAALVVVSIEKNNKKLFIQYIDNGKGFSEGISKNGLQNAENRIHAIQGSLTFDTELHKGCKFSINVPV
ncbi:ATP-binding protein [uncultured Kordia sp.]|uniref:sensor histidine kinase n=1 Tax=uncultured Kordia sp. TaxID=507699 RepID=UPI0026261409|nr:ATP-binding protein [uncultured Kordia sp.]